MANRKPFNLFVYGTLMNPSVFRAVLGMRFVFTSAEADGVEMFHSRDAVLDGYKKTSPDGTYLYAVPDPYGYIRGYLIGPLPGEAMQALLHYEGQNYLRKTLLVQTRNGREKAVVFVGDLKQLEHSFGYEFHDPLKQEILLRQKIEAAVQEAEREHFQTTDRLRRRAMEELHGPTIRDIVRKHFEIGGISDYIIRHSIRNEPLRDFARITSDAEAVAIAPHYLEMVVRQVIFNQVEEQVRRDFRFELEQMNPGPEYYERTLSSLAALRHLNARAPLLDLAVGDCLTDLPFTKSRLIDYIRWSIEAADALYDSAAIRKEIDFVRLGRGRGDIPLGAELEFSNIGHNVIRDPTAQAVCDPWYDGFLYFWDFALEILTWRLGGHIDDHRERISPRPRRGFFELALGMVSIEADLSKPVTRDPWVLNQIIQESVRFYRVAPHSMHLSMQLRGHHRAGRHRILPLSVLQCLMAIAGDPARGDDGKLRITRLGDIIHHEPMPQMIFSEIAKRYSSDAEDSDFPARDRQAEGAYVQQFKFIRLSPRLDYEPIAMCLKGLQLSLSPGTFMTADQYKYSRKVRDLFGELVAWGENPQPIPPSDVEHFLGHMQAGLMKERRGRPAHAKSYIAWSVDRIRQMLLRFNAMAEKGSDMKTELGTRNEKPGTGNR